MALRTQKPLQKKTKMARETYCLQCEQHEQDLEELQIIITEMEIKVSGMEAQVSDYKANMARTAREYIDLEMERVTGKPTHRSVSEI